VAELGLLPLMYPRLAGYHKQHPDLVDQTRTTKPPTSILVCYLDLYANVPEVFQVGEMEVAGELRTRR